jgi:hypothetical protein
MQVISVGYIPTGKGFLPSQLNAFETDQSIYKALLGEIFYE